MKNPLTPSGIEPATFRFVADRLNHCATAVPNNSMYLMYPTAVVFCRKYTFIHFTFLESISYFCYVFRRFLRGGEICFLCRKWGYFLKYEDPTGWEIIQEEIFPKRL